MIKFDSKNEDLKKITEHFGIETELTKLTEEVGELLNECYKCHFTGKNNGEVEDEMADVFVILAQIGLHFNVDTEKLANIFDEKVSRTIKRIDQGWYNKHR